MGMSSLLSTGSVAGQAAIVVSDAEASLRMLQSLQQSEEAAEASYKVNLEALENQCQTVDERLEAEQDKVKPIENAIEHYNGELEALQNVIDQQRSLINERLAAKSATPTWGDTDEESKALQAQKEAQEDEIRGLEEELARLEENADKLKRHIEDIEQLRREVEENVNTLTESSRQVHQEKDNYQSEGAIAIARLKDEAEQNERTCQHHYDLTQELLSGRQR